MERNGTQCWARRAPCLRARNFVRDTLTQELAENFLKQKIPRLRLNYVRTLSGRNLKMCFQTYYRRNFLKPSHRVPLRSIAFDCVLTLIWKPGINWNVTFKVIFSLSLDYVCYVCSTFVALLVLQLIVLHQISSACFNSTTVNGYLVACTRKK